MTIVMPALTLAVCSVGGYAVPVSLAPVIVLQLTEEVWTSVSWWVYLLADGLIFIIYAAVNEYCRKKGQANPVKSGIRNVIDRVWNKC